MKTLLHIFLTSIFLLSCLKANENVKFHEDARCTGSASCSACSNCTRCAHCSSGGTCGVCRGSSSGRSFYSSPKKHKTSTSYKKATTSRKAYSGTNAVKTKPVAVSFYGSEKLKTDVVSIAKTINVHKKPSLKATVIQKLRKGTTVKILENRNHWKKIKVIKSGNVGFVYSGNLK